MATSSSGTNRSGGISRSTAASKRLTPKPPRRSVQSSPWGAPETTGGSRLTRSLANSSSEEDLAPTPAQTAKRIYQRLTAWRRVVAKMVFALGVQAMARVLRGWEQRNDQICEEPQPFRRGQQPEGASSEGRSHLRRSSAGAVPVEHASSEHGDRVRPHSVPPGSGRPPRPDEGVLVGMQGMRQPLGENQRGRRNQGRVSRRRPHTEVKPFARARRAQRQSPLTPLLFSSPARRRRRPQRKRWKST